MKRIIKYKNYILGLITILLVVTISIGIKYIMQSKYKELPEVKLKNNIKKDKAMAIMVSNDGNKYQEYEKNTWPGEEYKFREAKCINEDGKIVENALSFDKEKRKANLRIKETVYCTLYFDYYGTGEKEDPYRIQYIEDLVDIQVAVDNEETYADKYFELTRDLDFQNNESYRNYQTKEYGDINGNSTDEELKTELTTGRGWKPIGFYTNTEAIERPFSGIFNGKNHRIDNLYIKNDIDEASIGLFGRIKNVEIDNLTLGGEITTSVNTNIGAFIASVTNVKMDNCHNEVNITSEVGNFQVGGLIGILRGDSEITNCTNKGNISNGNSTGGIIANIGNGATENFNVKVENCENRGTITNSLGMTTIGGLIGRTGEVVVNLTITNCKNYGLLTTGKSINTEQKIGGIMGSVATGSQVTIENSDNYGEIRSEFNESNPTFSSCGGGILGRVQGDNKGSVAKIIKSNNHSEINGVKRIGGIVGQINGNGTLYIDKSYNEGNMISSPHVKYDDSCGGIVGLINPGKAYVLNTYNKGNITSQVLSASGMVGNFNSYNTNAFIAINSYNIGNIINSRDKASGILHSINESGNGYVMLTLNNVYTAGTLNGTTGNYGFGNLGTRTQFNEINNVYHLSDYETSNLSVPGIITKSLNDMKSQTFVDLLNANKNSIDLSSIDSSLSEYTLCNWKLGSDNYPTLNC